MGLFEMTLSFHPVSFAHQCGVALQAGQHNGNMRMVSDF